ncbi:MAG TPA: oligosaccharide flippase family protein [Candidatus Woesebacteria bacterium]|nr:oligosaccharide flippase family protein [Candidatus Woesebacteria bacterium]
MVSLIQNSAKSLGFLFFQSGYSAVLGLITNLIITALAAKEVFGIYATTLATITIFNYISDIGLAGALIQKKEVEKDDLSTVFLVQQGIISSLVLVGFIATPFIQSFYRMPQDATYLYWAVLVGFFISSLKTIPSVLLERSVRFHEIVKVQIAENTLFYVVVSTCIIAGLNLYSFAVGVLVRACTGTVLMYLRSPWRPTLVFNTAALRSLLSFGVPFQANSFMALIKDEMMVIFLGRTLGFQGLAEVMWAKKWAEAPIRIIMDNVSKILFPVLSRLQDNGRYLQRTVNASIWLQTFILGPVILGIGVGMPLFIRLVPQYEKWSNALPILYVFCASAFFSTLSTPFMNVFNALKKPKIPLVFMVFWTVATWVLTPWFIRMYGPIGFAYVQLALSSSFVLVMYYAHKSLGLNFFSVYEVRDDVVHVMRLLYRRLMMKRMSAKQTSAQDIIQKLD